MNINRWEAIIKEAYRTQDRTNIWLSAALQCEASELADLVVKSDGYGIPYDLEKVRSEAGDVLNFLTAFLQAHGLTLEDAMKHNTRKLYARGWI